MSLTQRFAAYIFSAMTAIREREESDYVQETIAQINAIAKDELQKIFTEMVQTIGEANYSGEIESESSYFSGGYKQYAPLEDTTIKRKSYYTKDKDADMPLRYHGFYNKSPDALYTVLDRMSDHNQLASRLFEALGEYKPRSYRTEYRDVDIEEGMYDRPSAKRRTTRTRWKDVVSQKVVDEIRRNADRYTFIRGDMTKTGFYDGISKRHISLERAIAEGRVKRKVRIKVESQLFQAVEDNEYGFTVAMIPVIRQYSKKAANKVQLLMEELDRNFIDIFFSAVFGRVAARLKFIDKRFNNDDLGEI